MNWLKGENCVVIIKRSICIPLSSFLVGFFFWFLPIKSWPKKSVSIAMTATIVAMATHDAAVTVLAWGSGWGLYLASSPSRWSSSSLSSVLVGVTGPDKRWPRDRPLPSPQSGPCPRPATSSTTTNTGTSTPPATPTSPCSRTLKAPCARHPPTRPREGP